MRNNKVGVVIVSIIIVVLSLFFISKKALESEEAKNVENDEIFTMYVSINPIIKINFKESYRVCENKKTNNKCDLKTTIVDYELVNEEAKNIYTNLDIMGKDILEAIPQLVKNIYDKEKHFTTININTNWIYGYSANTIYSNLVNTHKFDLIYRVNVEEEKELDEEKLRNLEYVSKTITKDEIALVNVEELTNKHYEPSLIYSKQKFTIEMFGTKETIDNLDIDKMDLYIDLISYKNINPNIDETGIYKQKLYLNTDEDIYFTITPKELEFEMVYTPTYDWSKSNSDVESILNKYKISVVNLTINNKDAVSCFKDEDEIKCVFTGLDLTIDELKKVYDRFKIMYNSEGILVGADNIPSICLHKNYKYDSKIRYQCLSQILLKW